METTIRLNMEHYISRLNIDHYISRLNIEHYVARLNIEHYKKLLETDIDETKREIVMRLLAEEQANLVEVISKAIAKLKKISTKKSPLLPNAGLCPGSNRRWGTRGRASGGLPPLMILFVQATA